MNITMFNAILEADTGGVLYVKMFLEIWQNSQENTLSQSLFFNKVVDRDCFSSKTDVMISKF